MQKKQVLGSVVVVGIFVAIKLLPRVLAEQAEEQARRDAVWHVLDERVQAEARALAATMAPVVVERAAYTVTLAEGTKSSCIVIATYAASSEAEARPVLQAAIMTLRMR